MERITPEQLILKPEIRTLIAWYREQGAEYDHMDDANLAVYMSLRTKIMVDGDVAGAVRIWVKEQK